MSKVRRIFIIGHPGAGKAVLGKALAEKLGWQFIDADFGLEYRVGRTLVEFLGKQGEEAIYNCQAEILNSLLVKENIVVTTDASIVCNERNRKILSSEFVVNLKVSVSIQLERISRNSKPFLTTDIQGFLAKLHQERDELYNQSAHFVIDSDDNALEEHVLSITKILDADDLDKLKILDDKDLIFFHKKLHIPVRLPVQQAICFKLLVQGKTSKEIAREMNISYRTVEGYIAKTIEQLGCASSKELISLYFDKP